MRKQKEIQAQIDKLMARGERLLQEGQFPEAQVAFEGVLRLDPGQAHAKDRLSLAERKTGEAFFIRWFPNEGPGLSFFAPRGRESEGRTVTEALGRTASVAGVATDDRGVDRVEFHLGGKLIAEQRPLPSLDAVASARLLSFQREFPLEPGRNDLVVTAFDEAGLSRTQTFEITRRLRLYETSTLPARRLRRERWAIVGAGFGVQRMRRRRARAPPLQPLHRGGPRARRRHVLRSGEAHRAHPERAPPQQPHDHGRAPHREDHVPLSPQEGPRSRTSWGDYRFFPVFTDLQGVPEQSFFHALMGDVVDDLNLSPATRADLRFGPEGEEYDGRDFSHDLQRVIEELKTRTPKKVKLALLIDEVDVLNEYSERVNQRLRSIFMKTFSENLVAVMSGVGIKRTLEERGQPLVQLLRRDRDHRSSRARRRRRSSRPRWRGSSATSRKRWRAILELSELKPYLIQKFCIHAVNHMLEEGRTTIGTAGRRDRCATTASQEASASAEGEPHRSARVRLKLWQTRGPSQDGACAIPSSPGSWVRGDNFFGRAALLREVLEGERHSLWVRGGAPPGQDQPPQGARAAACSRARTRPSSRSTGTCRGAPTPAASPRAFLGSVEDSEPFRRATDISVEDLEGLSVDGHAHHPRPPHRAQRLAAAPARGRGGGVPDRRPERPAVLPRLRRVSRRAPDVRTVITSTRRSRASTSAPTSRPRPSSRASSPRST